MSLLFLLANLGVINGLLLGFYLVFRRKHKLAEKYFGFLLLALSIRIGKSVFFYFDRGTDKLILQLGLSACVFIGPFFYLYLKSLFNQRTSASKQDVGLLVLLLMSIVTVGFIFPYRTYPDIWNQYIVYGIYGVWTFFVLLPLIQHGKWAVNLILKPKGKELFLLIITLAVLFITSLYQFALYVKGFTYIWGAIVFSTAFYILMVRALINRKQFIPTSVMGASLPEDRLVLQLLDEVMGRDKPYLAQGLKLEDLAGLIGVSKHTLSRVLNEQYTHGFAHYISTYRVNEAKQLIASRPELSLEGIGYESGFKSKSAFFETFKKIADSTPASYKKSLKR